MFDSVIKEILFDAEKQYSYELPYHNWDHAKETMVYVQKLAEVNHLSDFNKSTLMIAAAWHDAGYHINNHGFKTKEDYSVFLIERELKKHNKSGYITPVKILIESTKHNADRRTKVERIMHIADMYNIGQKYETFIDASCALFQENYSEVHGSWGKWCEQSQKLIEKELDEFSNYSDIVFPEGLSTFQDRAIINLDRLKHRNKKR